MSAKWHVSILFVFVYLAIFHLWMVVGAGWRIMSTTAVGGALVAILVRAARQKYFVNRWDLAFHASVVLDIGLEGFFLSVHEDFGFYFCALGFTAGIAGYRATMMRKQIATDKSLAR